MDGFARRSRPYRERRREEKRRFVFVFFLFWLAAVFEKLDTFTVGGDMAVNILCEVSRERSVQQ